jgi:hypothetical protein
MDLFNGRGPEMTGLTVAESIAYAIDSLAAHSYGAAVLDFPVLP